MKKVMFLFLFIPACLEKPQQYNRNTITSFSQTLPRSAISAEMEERCYSSTEAYARCFPPGEATVNEQNPDMSPGYFYSDYHHYVPSTSGTHYVPGYTRGNGTYVRGYYRR